MNYFESSGIEHFSINSEYKLNHQLMEFEIFKLNLYSNIIVLLRNIMI